MNVTINCKVTLTNAAGDGLDPTVGESRRLAGAATRCVSDALRASAFDGFDRSLPPGVKLQVESVDFDPFSIAVIGGKDAHKMPK